MKTWDCPHCGMRTHKDPCGNCGEPLPTATSDPPDEPQRYNPQEGDSLESVAYNACLLADSLGKPVRFTFKETSMTVMPGSSDDQIAQKFAQEQAHRMTMRAVIKAWEKGHKDLLFDMPGHVTTVADHPCPRCKGDNLNRVRPAIPLRVLSGLYHCPDCGYRNSTTNHIARLAFPLEPLPSGALLLYDKNPDVTATVVGDGTPEEVTHGD